MACELVVESYQEKKDSCNVLSQAVMTSVNTDHAGHEMSLHSHIVLSFSQQIVNGKAGPTSAL